MGSIFSYLNFFYIFNNVVFGGYWLSCGTCRFIYWTFDVFLCFNISDVNGVLFAFYDVAMGVEVIV